MDLIAAIATGAAASAIGILRLSGDGCFAACDRVFRPAGGRPFGDQEPRKLVMGEMLDSRGRVVDRGMAVRFPAPHSYTGEDSGSSSRPFWPPEPARPARGSSPGGPF